MVSVKEIVDVLNSEIISIYGNVDNVYVKYLKPLELVDVYTLDWIGSSKHEKQQIAEQSKARVIVCDTSVFYSEIIKLQGKLLIQVSNPKLAIAMVADVFFVIKQVPGIHNSSYIHPGSKIAASAFIGSNCSIGKCNIGEKTKIFPNVTIYDSVTIGNNVTIQAGAVIGTDGLGCERKRDGTLVKFPHLGGVIIHDNVEIGANCQISRGVLTDTIIGAGSKINGLCFIAHNCILGKNVWITGNSMIAGSVKVEDNVIIYSNVIIREHRIVGKGATIGMGSVVTKNIPLGETWIGNPAKKFLK